MTTFSPTGGFRGIVVDELEDDFPPPDVSEARGGGGRTAAEMDGAAWR